MPRARKALRDFERKQKQHYDTISDLYASHYGDDASYAFYEQLVFSKLFKDVPLEGARVLDAMCGPGQASRFLTPKGAKVTGLDLSAEAKGPYLARNPAATFVQSSILDTPFEDSSFDVVVILGGLHHLHPMMDSAFTEIHRILAPGGHFLFFEPPSGALPDLARKIWYRFDPLFEKNEKSIDLAHIRDVVSGKFDWLDSGFGGGPAYFLIYNSVVFRLPVALKTPLLGPMVAAERWVTPLIPKLLASYCWVRLRKTAA